MNKITWQPDNRPPQADRVAIIEKKKIWKKKTKKQILDAMMSMTNGDLNAACNLEDHIIKVMAVRFLYESIKKIV